MKPWVAILLALLVAWVGYNTYRDHQAELARAEWQRVTDSLITAGVIKDSLNLVRQREIDNLELAAQDALVRSREAENRAGALSLGARTLRASLDSARTALDSLPLAVAVIQKQDTIIATQDSVIRFQRTAHSALETANVLLHQRITSDSGRIVDLTTQLLNPPTPPRPPMGGFLNFLPFKVQPCAFAGLTTQGEARAGLGVCLTR